MVTARKSSEWDGSIPAAVKFIGEHGNSLIVVHETPPLVRRVVWSRRLTRLSLPYTVTIAELSQPLIGRKVASVYGARIYFSNKPLRSLNSPLYHSALLNVNSTGNMCLGTYLSGANWQEALHNLLLRVWDSSFNGSLGNHVKARYPFLFPIHKWRQLTTQDPKYALTVNWDLAGTVRTVPGCASLKRNRSKGS